MAISKLQVAELEMLAYDFEETSNRLVAHMATMFVAGTKLQVGGDSYTVREVSRLSLHAVNDVTGYTRLIPYGECVELLRSLKWDT